MAYGSLSVDTLTSSTGQVFSPSSSVMKNRIINGGMVIDQRNAGASVTASTTSAFTYTLDRWSYYATAASKFTVQQNAGSVTPPVGFTKYLGVTSSSAYSVSSTDILTINQAIEGFNIADLNWGTANAKTVTLSFQVYSSLTGTFGGALSNSASTQYYPFSYTVSSANTWTTVSVTIAGSTTGTWASDNSAGLYIYFGLGVGSSKSGTAGSWGSTAVYSATGATSVVGTSGATFYITGVQLEAGSVASQFEYRQYGTEFALCQRYYNRLFGNDKNLPVGLLNQGAYSTAVVLPTAMRATPSLDQIAASYWRFNGSTAGETLTNTWTLSGSSNNLTVYLNASAVPGGSNGYAVISRAYDTSNYLGFSAEL